MHVPNYQFLGPGKCLTGRLARGERGINALDRAALNHDLAYAGNENMWLAKQELIKVPFARIAAPDTEGEEQVAALITACCLVSKVTLEKLCARVRKAFFICLKKKKVRKVSSHGPGEKRKEKKRGRKSRKLLENRLHALYYDLKNPTTYVSTQQLQTAVEDKDPEKLQNWLEQQKAYTLHKPVRYRFPRRMKRLQRSRLLRS